MNKKKAMAFLLVSVMAGSMLAGCGSDASSAQGSSSKSAESSNNDSYTVKMDGKGFTKKVSDGDKVHAGDILVEADLEEIKNAGYQTTTMMILTNTDEFGNVTKAEPAEVKTTSKVMTLTK